MSATHRFQRSAAERAIHAIPASLLRLDHLRLDRIAIAALICTRRGLRRSLRLLLLLVVVRARARHQLHDAAGEARRIAHLPNKEGVDANDSSRRS